MKTRQECFAVRASVAAVRVAVMAMALVPVAYAAGPDAADPAVDRADQSHQHDRGRRRLREPGLVQVRPVQRPLQQGRLRHLQHRRARRRVLRQRQRAALAHLRDEPRPRRPVHLRRIRRPGHVQGLGFVRPAAQQLRDRRHVPDAIPGRGLQSADAAEELGQAGRAAGERDRRQFSIPLAHHRACEHRGERRVDAADRGAAGDRHQHHRERRPGFPERRPRHDAQDLRRRLQRQFQPALGVHGECEPDAAGRTRSRCR